ncbi:MAG: dihydroxyacetone kinase subunit DhaK, partial [Propionibacteriaceae bacterium]|nr:dihydroxyacetone kinase subunit DhaK [Propionibacteriaceae bacterium]
RVKIGTAAEIADMLVRPILEDLDYRGSEVILFVNGMGATPLIELFIVYGEVAKILEAEGVRVVRNLTGNYITSLDMAGCSVTLLKADDEMIHLWDAPVVTPGLRWGR